MDDFLDIVVPFFIGVVIVVLLSVGIVALNDWAEKPDRADCASINGQYVSEYRGSDVCYVDGKVARSYG